jgi:hypothetical protein
LEGERTIAATSVISPPDAAEPSIIDAVYRPDIASPKLEPAQIRPGTRGGSGDNIRAFHDPMTLEQVFPGLQSAPASAIISLADNVLDFKGPARETGSAFALAQSNLLISQIKAIDPNYRFQSLGFPETLQGQINQINDLRLDRAAAFFRLQGEARPLQVETLRFLQRRADAAYEEGVLRLQEGSLDIRLSAQEAIGNFIDRHARERLRELYRRLGISTAKGAQVRVNAREYDTSGTDLTFRRPDARVGNVAFDVTLTQKTDRTAQIRGFFDADVQPQQVVIIRPRQLGKGSTYIITRPGKYP